MFTGLFPTTFNQTINTTESKVTFEISNMGGMKTVKGSFTGMQGDLVFDENNLESSHFKVCIDAATVNTDNQKRDDHLKNEDFFEVATYPVICFKSKIIAKNKDGFVTNGELTMHGVTKTIEIPFTVIEGVFDGQFELKRKDYGVGPNGGFMVGKTVKVGIVCKVD